VRRKGEEEVWEDGKGDDELEGWLMSITRLRTGAAVTLFVLFAVELAALAPAPAVAVAPAPQWTVTAVSGPTNFPPAANGVEKVAIAAGAGTFTLTFAGQTTSNIPYNATASTLASDLNALSTIGGVGGSVTVTGGPGDPGATNPYVVTFGGSLAGIHVEQLVVNASSLFDAVGDTFKCTGGPEGVSGYQWMRNGHTIVGASASSYTAVAGDAGAAIQCVTVVAQRAGGPASVGVSQPPRIVAPVPSTPLPVPPQNIPEPGGSAAAGETITCGTGSWAGAPTFTYQWFKNGAPISGAASETYVVQGADVRSNIQCEVTGTNAGGSVTQASPNKNTSPALEFFESPPQATATSPLASVSTQTTGGSTGIYKVTVMNTGGAPSDGSPITVVDTLPGGLTLGAAGITGEDQLSGSSQLSCAGLTCTYTGTIVADDTLTLTVPVVIGPSAGSSVTNTVTVAGGGAHEASVSTPTTVSSTPAAFGVSPGSGVSALSSTQAGAHADLTTMLAFNTTDRTAEDGDFVLAGNPRNTVYDLPPGFAGDVADAPTCPEAAFSKQSELFAAQTCPLSTQVGTVTFTLDLGFTTFIPTVPVYNLTPNPGEVAKLGFFAANFGVQGEISVRPGDYGVRTTFTNIDETPAALDTAALSIWGVPADPSHDRMRGLVCNGGGACSYFNSAGEVPGVTGQSSTTPAIPYLTNPTECSGKPLLATISASSWQQPGTAATVGANLGEVTGCNLLEFTPELMAAPDTSLSDTPAGLTVDVKLPQEGLTSPRGLSSADVKNTTVTLPTGLVVNPGQATGLRACQFSEDGVGREGPASCPNASKIGTDEIETPLLKRKLEGGIYVLQSNPPDVKLLVTASNPLYGVYVKLIGDVHLDPTTAQLTTTFPETPQLPFSEFKLFFKGGPQPPLATPVACGSYTSHSDFTPWSTPLVPDASPTTGFTINGGPLGSACAAPLPFGPSMVAGSTSDQAGGFTDFSMLLQRGDGQQRLSSLRFTTPEGLLAMISKVPPCGEPAAAQGACSPASQIGHVLVESGPGQDPLVVPQPGAPQAPIYLTGRYKGAPYGLSIAVPVIAGPFDLGTTVVRASIAVDPHTSQITVTSDPLPTILDGVPTDLRTINAVVDREGFMFNPTSCNSESFVGTATSTEGTVAPISSRFEVGSCQSLPFKPTLTTLTQARTSKANGASLHVRVTSGPGQANIAKVKVDLPKQLPSRLSTLQKACRASVFEANPSSCPEASIVGTGTAITPVLKSPLMGPAYLVSHGGAAFPDLEIVLQGEGITLILDGQTDIKKGITISSFASVPDAPVTSFDLVLPEGPHSALGATTNLCKGTLAMPTLLTGQNGAVVKQTTKIAVAGCVKHKHPRGFRKHRRGGRRKT
jgi:uncharacterized repeat protein (TIGR01451 family)